MEDNFQQLGISCMRNILIIFFSYIFMRFFCATKYGNTFTKTGVTSLHITIRSKNMRTEDHPDRCIYMLTNKYRK